LRHRLSGHEELHGANKETIGGEPNKITRVMTSDLGGMSHTAEIGEALSGVASAAFTLWRTVLAL
jgi:hypothetical protein